MAVVIASMLAGTTLGLLAGYFRALDGVIMRVVDAMMSLPDILLAIFLVAVLGASAGNVVLALAIVYTPRVTRVVRGSTSSAPRAAPGRPGDPEGRPPGTARAGPPGIPRSTAGS